MSATRPYVFGYVLCSKIYCMNRGVEIIKFSTCPGASKKSNCTCT